MSDKNDGIIKALDDFLQDEDDESIPQFEKENLVLEPLLDEISAIKDEAIKNFVRSVLLKSELFWSIPSSSGNSNPPDEQDVGGNVLHTKRVFRVCILLSDAHLLESIERDMLLASALLHDITKGVEISDVPVYDEFHPYTVDRFVRQVKLEDEIRGAEHESTMLYIQEDHCNKILRAIRCHMGIYSPIPETYPVNELEMILYTADILATKLHWIIDGDEPIMERWIYAAR